jgi:hypothetical protein
LWGFLFREPPRWRTDASANFDQLTGVRAEVLTFARP